MTSLSAKEAHQRLHDNNTVLLDVRTAAEYRSHHAEGALHLPLDEISADAVKELAGTDKTILMICQGGRRSLTACGKLSGAGLTNLINVEGGTSAWEAAGLPVIKGEPVLSIERQVRIAAGLLVVAGVVLGAFVDPLWLILPGFVGTGLAFAGITDSCGMGMALAKMPWNR